MDTKNTETERCPGCGEQPTWNLYARVDGFGRVLALVMPNADGVLTSEAPKGPQWYAIGWPVNPHDTGERMIRAILESGWDNVPEEMLSIPSRRAK